MVNCKTRVSVTAQTHNTPYEHALSNAQHGELGFSLPYLPSLLWSHVLFSLVISIFHLQM